MAKTARDVVGLVPISARATAIAERGEQALARANGVADVRRVEKWLRKARNIVAEATEKREEINKVGKVWIRAIRKGGRLLREMTEKGERHSGRGNNPPKLASRRARPTPPTIAEMGLTWNRASRWLQVDSLPDDVFAELEQERLMNPDGILSLEDFLAAAKHLQRERQKLESVVSTTAAITRAACLDWLPQQPDCDLLLTDPPYSTDVEDIETFVKWLPVALKKVKRTGSAYVCTGAYENELRAYLTIPRPAHLMAPQVLVWTYRNRIGPAPDGYKLNWQAVFYYRGLDAPPLDCPELNERFAVQDVNAPDGRQGDRWHEWQKPDELCERFVRHASKPGDLVLDPYAGSGSFILAAATLGRVAHGCDIDPAMVALAKKRGCRVKR